MAVVFQRRLAEILLYIMNYSVAILRLPTRIIHALRVPLADAIRNLDIIKQRKQYRGVVNFLYNNIIVQFSLCFWSGNYRLDDRQKGVEKHELFNTVYDQTSPFKKYTLTISPLLSLLTTPLQPWISLGDLTMLVSTIVILGINQDISFIKDLFQSIPKSSFGPGDSAAASKPQHSSQQAASLNRYSRSSTLDSHVKPDAQTGAESKSAAAVGEQDSTVPSIRGDQLV